MNKVRLWRIGRIALIFSPLLSIILPMTQVGAFSFLSLSFLNSSSTYSQDGHVAAHFNNSQDLDILEPANHIDPNPAKGGGSISVIENKALFASNSLDGRVVDINGSNNNGQINVYEVREGDSLSEIAEMFGVSMNTIRWANDFDGEIQPGQTLVILPISGVRHIVKSGGTIQDIADIYDADVREIALFNGIDENIALKPGDEIIVPHAEIHTDSDDHDHGKTSGKAYVKAGVSGGVTASSGYYSNPLPGSIVTQGIHGYNGIDIGAPLGTPIYAAAAGSVITSKQGGWNGGYGSMIIISHDNGTQTLYSHMSENAVYVGQKVTKGQVIGYVGSTGQSTGNHLHFEVRGAKNPIAACAVGKACQY